MKQCESCNTPFSSGQILKSTWIGYYPIKCSKCGTVYEHTLMNRLLVALIVMVSFVSTYFISEHYSLGYISILLALLLIGILILISTPFYKFRKVS